MSKAKYWFGCRQISPEPPGKAIACGPYDTKEEAIRERDRARAWNFRITVVFVADTEEEAGKKAEEWTL
jgi:hypothetical protein